MCNLAFISLVFERFTFPQCLISKRQSFIDDNQMTHGKVISGVPNQSLIIHDGGTVL